MAKELSDPLLSPPPSPSMSQTWYDAVDAAKKKSYELLSKISSIIFWTGVALQHTASLLSKASTLINFSAIPLSHFSYLISYSQLTEILTSSVYGLYGIGYTVWLLALFKKPTPSNATLSAKFTWMMTCGLGIGASLLFGLSLYVPGLNIVVSFVELLANFFRVTGNYLDYRESIMNGSAEPKEIKSKYKYYIFTYGCTLIPLIFFITFALTLSSPALMTLFLLPALIITGMQLVLGVYSVLHHPSVPAAQKPKDAPVLAQHPTDPEESLELVEDSTIIPSWFFNYGSQEPITRENYSRDFSSSPGYSI